MTIELVTNISDKILDCLLSGRKVFDDAILELLAEVDSIIRASAFQDLPPSFHRLCEHVRNMVQSYEIRDVSTEIALVYGKLWSLTFLVEIAEHEVSSKRPISEDAKRLESKFKLFKAIMDRKGIDHAGLAEVVGISASQLSQDISKLDDGRFFYYRRLGRGKYYYITEDGKELISAIEKLRYYNRKVEALSNIKSLLEEDFERRIPNEGNSYVQSQSFAFEIFSDQFNLMRNNRADAITVRKGNHNSIHSTTKTVASERLYKAMCYMLKDAEDTADSIKDTKSQSNYDIAETTPLKQGMNKQLRRV